MIEELSLHKSASVCGIAKNTSFQWRHRFFCKYRQLGKMNGIVAADKAYFLQSFKGQRHLPRSPNAVAKPLRKARQGTAARARGGRLPWQDC